MRDDPPVTERDEAKSAAGQALASGDDVTLAGADDDPLTAILSRGKTHRGRFRAAYAVLAVLAAIAIAAFVGLLIRGGPTDARPWSAFQPAGEEIAAAQEIAAFVESRYLAEDGTPLVDVSADWLNLQSSPIEFVSIEQPDLNGRSDQLLLPVGEASSIRFGLCGEGEKCAITKGEASPERLRYLSRASLELALYSFRYMPQVDSVVAYLPPPVGTEPTWALFFQRSDVAALLDAPIDDLLAPAVPVSAADLAGAEAELVDELTVPVRFAYEFWETQEGETVLGLAAPSGE
ncbi:MAG: hypothetical protein ACR2OD_06000 [Gaiellaceae bacterium]